MLKGYVLNVIIQSTIFLLQSSITLVSVQGLVRPPLAYSVQQKKDQKHSVTLYTLEYSVNFCYYQASPNPGRKAGTIMTTAIYLTEQVIDMVHVCGSGLLIFVLRQDKELGWSLTT